MKLKALLLISYLCATFPVFSQEHVIRAMDFRGQNINDILMVLAEAGRQSVIADETVTGNATFHFSDSSFEEALYRFTDACNLFVEQKHNAYYVSRIKISKEGELIDVYAENVDTETLVRALSRSIGKTIIYDQLPRASISLNSEKAKALDLLEIVVKRHPEYSVTEENGAFYIKRAQDNPQSGYGRLGGASITERNGLYTMNIQRASFSQIISLLFRTGKREYSLLHRGDTSLDNLYFQDKEFDALLRLVLEQANCDFTENGSVYYIFEVQRRDILKKLRDVNVIQLRHITVDNALALLPNEYSAGAFVKADKTSNSVYLSGSTEEITPIADFIAMLDVPEEDKTFSRFEVHFMPVKDFIALLPADLARAAPVVVPGSNAFIANISREQKEKFVGYIDLVDRQNAGTPVRLKFIRSEELSQFLPPSINKEDLVITADPTLVFYKGSRDKYAYFSEQLKLMDQPKPQIRYQLLVIQYQRSDNINWSRGVNVNPAKDSGSGTAGSGMFSGVFSNLVNVNFDVISGLGYRFALNLNMQIGEDKAKILADTTLNGITGQDIKFENTTTFRYRDTTIDPETGKPFYTGVTREITSGLVLNINGWVSGDGMVTMDVKANVSKQDESGINASATTNPPPTSERVVNTRVRTNSGTPVVIGGLLQVEKVENIKKIPVLGSIPLLGRLFQDVIVQDNTTEMIIYIVPHVHNGPVRTLDYSKKIGDYYGKYVGRD